MLGSRHVQTAVKNQKLMQVTLPAVTLEVEPGPVQSADAAKPIAQALGQQ
jgi:hypothetical protein